MINTNSNGIAPTASRYRVGAKGGRVAVAAQEFWNRLSRTEFVEAHSLAWDVAKAHDLKPISLLTHVHKLAAAGYLEKELRYVDTTREWETTSGRATQPVRRKRVFYRIAKGQ